MSIDKNEKGCFPPRLDILSPLKEIFKAKRNFWSVYGARRATKPNRSGNYFEVITNIDLVSKILQADKPCHRVRTKICAFNAAFNSKSYRSHETPKNHASTAGESNPRRWHASLLI